MDCAFISSNIRFDNPADGPNAWPHRREKLAAVLRSHAPLVIGTQEGRQAQLEDLAALLPDHVLVSAHRPWIAERMYPTLFLHKDAVPPLDTGDVWLSETPEVPGSLSFGSAFPRLCTWMRIVCGGQRLLVVNAHLDHLQEETRAAQARVLADYFKQLKRGDEALVILGDFNASPDSRARAELLTAFPCLYDPWKKLGLPEESSHHPFSGTHPEGNRIDWILLDGRCRTKEVFLDKSAPEGLWPSDHFPLVCRFSL